MNANDANQEQISHELHELTRMKKRYRVFGIGYWVLGIGYLVFVPPIASKLFFLDLLCNFRMQRESYLRTENGSHQEQFNLEES
jgi:hypothetical protein